MGIRTDTSSSDGTVFSEDVLKIEICGSNEDYLTVIDVPGIFRNATEGITTKDDIQLVQNMVKGYIKNNRTITLAVIPSNVDIATQEILTLAEDCDKAGERTLGVLTKPDLVTERSAQAAVCNLVLGKKKPLTLGYYVVRNRGADDDDVFDPAVVEQMFRDEPWNGLPKDRVGVQALKARLGELLSQITRREFPGLRNDVTKQLAECNRELQGLGPSRQTEQEQRLFLSTMARMFQELVQAARNAHYSNHSEFEEKKELRLITYVVNLTELFNYYFEWKAHLRHFEGAGKKEVHDMGNDAEADAIKDVDQKEKFVKDIDLDNNPVLENIIIKDRLFAAPQDGIMHWIEGLYLRSRGLELGTFGGAILSSAFKEQSSKWNCMTKAYLSNVIVVIHRFMVTVLEMLCPDKSVREEIWASILDDVLKGYLRGMDQAVFLLDIERAKKPYTLNHYFNENLQKARGTRKKNLLKPKAKQELELYDTFQQKARRTDNLVVDLDLVEQQTTNQSNLEQVKEEIHDILQSYYKVARKRFVDNVYHQAVDHFLLTGPMSPLAVFSQEWVIKLDAEQLEAIAGEALITKERRAALMKKIQDLEGAMRILRH
jgi:Dynamin central region/Dynamin family